MSNHVTQEVIQTNRAPQAVGPYSQGIVSGNLIFVSGQLPLNPENGEFVPGGIREMTARIIENIKAILEEAGSSLDRVVKTTVFLADMADFVDMNEVYAEHFRNHYPARSTVQVAALPKNARIEMEAVAVR